MKHKFVFVFLLLVTVAINIFGQAPKITSFSPASGPVGTTVTINGSGFNFIPDSNVVYFGATQAVVNSSDAAQLMVTVPAGATYKPITVLNKVTRLMVQSTVAFRASFSPAASGIDPPVRLSPAIGVADVQVADIDGDGKPDIIATNPTLRLLMIYRNKSATGKIDTASFAAPIMYHTGPQPGIMAVNDLDGDGKPDIVLMNVGLSGTPNGNNSLMLFHNASTPGHINLTAVAIVDSTATTPVSYNFQLKPGDNVARVGDLDGDGKPDIAVLNTAGSVTIYRNMYVAGQPLKTILGAPVTFAVGLNATSLAIGDMDNDGKLDLVTTNYNAYSITVLRNNSATGSTGSSFQRIDFPLAYQPFTVTLDDIDGDGKLDAVIGRADGGPTALIHNTSTPGSFNGTAIGLANLNLLSNYNDDIVIQDMDGDAKPDVLSLNADLNEVDQFVNNAAPGQTSPDYFNDKIKLPLVTIPDCIADLDGDGRPDMIIGSVFGIDIYHSTFSAVQPPVTPSNLEAWSIYPNPASTSANLKYNLPAQSAVTITIYNEVGRLITTYKLGQESAGVHISTIATSNLKTGVYIVTLAANGYSKSGKLIVQ